MTATFRNGYLGYMFEFDHICPSGQRNPVALLMTVGQRVGGLSHILLDDMRTLDDRRIDMLVASTGQWSLCEGQSIDQLWREI